MSFKHTQIRNKKQIKKDIIYHIFYIFRSKKVINVRIQYLFIFKR
jgi:hypothetical protein